MRERVVWIDVAKGLGIVAVVVGHVSHGRTGAWLVAKEAVTLFHMPLFFLLSGLVARPLAPLTGAARRARSLLLPYLSFFLLLVGVVVAEQAAAGGPLTLWRTLWAAVLGGPYLYGYFGPFWFVTCLWAALVAWDAAARVAAPRSAGMAALAGLALAAALLLQSAPPGPRVPFSLDAVPLAFAWIWAGGWLAEERIASRGVLAAALAVAAICGGLALAGWEFSFDMRGGDYGPPGAGLALAWALAVLTMRGARLLARVRGLGPALASLGRASLVVLFLHHAIQVMLARRGVPPGALVAVAVALPWAAHLALSRSPLLALAFLGRAPARPSIAARAAA
ncbi:acyltransferase family protein [Rubellimicrobium aerolatum]|uniref:Acyltransferase family protein n=1 Tax=Rubellimicrobium aerolatum TaxID=490979 RepID=A0ABW0SGE6_9RHOB|nr:acyltransferase family protein [Rubellimicrobium aerolatum]MBP1807325.1 fucose 4-O-acetylase-like acetyltransferase [Rubellimicrobium aerolatum]